MLIRNKKNSGYTLVETIIYMAILTLFIYAIISTLVLIFKTNKTTGAAESVSNTAIFILERVNREIKTATSIDYASSTFGATSSVLFLNSLTSTSSPRTVKFYLDSGKVRVDENGAYLGPLFYTNSTTTKLLFKVATSTGQTIVRTELIIEGGLPQYKKTESFLY